MIKNKKGFTLVEIVIVIAIIGLMAVIVIPKIADIFGDSVDKRMKIQESRINEAVLLYLEDYCINPLGNNRCPFTRNDNLKYSGRIDLDTLIDNDYIDKVVLQGTECSGCIDLDNNEPTTYVSCGEAYETEGFSCR